MPFVGYFFVSRATLALRGRYLKVLFCPPALIWALLAVVMLYWVVRNMPAHPFSLLAP